MTPSHAVEYLELLARGIDPATGELLPADSPLHAPDVVRALFMGARAIDAQRAREGASVNATRHDRPEMNGMNHPGFRGGSMA